MKPQVRVFHDVQTLANAAADEFVRLANESSKESDTFSVVLSGGSTPKHLFRALASEENRGRLAWDQVHFFWGDERCVPVDHPDSNFGVARGLLLEPLAIPPGNIHRFKAELGDPAEAANQYETELRNFFGLRHEGQLPRFDLVSLGLGVDGHTASLFPGSAAIAEDVRLVSANWVEKLNSFRLTLTARAFNNAARILFLVTGAEKAGVVRDVLEPQADAAEYPAQLIKPWNGDLLWYLDREAAAQLSVTR